MPMPLSFTYAKLSEAVEIFVTHEDDARQRLLAAELPLCLVSSESLPNPFDEQWSRLWEMLTEKGKKQDYTAYRYTVIQMRKKRAAQFIAEIWTIKSMLESFVPRGPHN